MNTYKCDQCPAAFRLHGELRTHRQQHFLEQKGISGDQSSQESFDRNPIDKDANNGSVEFQSLLGDAARQEEVRFEMLQLETSSGKQQQIVDVHFVTNN